MIGETVILVEGCTDAKDPVRMKSREAGTP
jgi:hypothetical protein